MTHNSSLGKWREVQHGESLSCRQRRNLSMKLNVTRLRKNRHRNHFLVYYHVIRYVSTTGLKQKACENWESLIEETAV